MKFQRWQSAHYSMGRALFLRDQYATPGETASQHGVRMYQTYCSIQIAPLLGFSPLPRTRMTSTKTIWKPGPGRRRRSLPRRTGIAKGSRKENLQQVCRTCSQYLAWVARRAGSQSKIVAGTAPKYSEKFAKLMCIPMVLASP